MKKLYIASRFRNKKLIQGLIRAFPPHYEVVSTWHNLADSEDGTHTEAAHRDLLEIRKCDAVLVVTHDCELVPGGMHFEAGYAYGLGKEVYFLGPAVNIFYEYVGTPVDYSFYKAET